LLSASTICFQVQYIFLSPNRPIEENLQRAIKAQIDPEAFDKMRGTVSFPFEPGGHGRIAVKVVFFGGMKWCG
jgi:adenine-specific DNA-methyltransferase